jgi:hypothetical protein
MQHPASYTCPSCWETIEILVDPSAGRVQRYVEDCPVCCRPNVLSVAIERGGIPRVSAGAE